jgi:thiamine pyrophosphate-dependent acetolactate synthase large subunit-like protein
VPVVVIAGDVYRDELGAGDVEGLEIVSLVERFGDERANSDVLECVEEVVAQVLSERGGSR